MKILWLYKYMENYDFDNNLHLKYVQWMKNNGYDVICYGPNIEKAYPDLVQLQYDRSLTWQEIVRKTQADVAIVMTKSRMWEYYNPFNGRYHGYWLPNDFNSKIIPKLDIDEDHMYERNDSWHLETGIDLILQRHSSQAMRLGRVPTTWAPFSVDEKSFPNKHGQRNNKICRCGSASELYPTRMDSTDRLLKHNLVDVKPSHGPADFMNENQYADCLNKYSAVLVGVVVHGYPITPAKVFEIQSCGAVLLIDEIPGMHYIFPANSYVVYKPYTDDVVQKAQWITQNSGIVADIGEKATQGVLHAHTHKIRTEQLIKLISDRIWEKPLGWNTLVRDYVL